MIHITSYGTPAGIRITSCEVDMTVSLDVVAQRVNARPRRGRCGKAGELVDMLREAERLSRAIGDELGATIEIKFRPGDVARVIGALAALQARLLRERLRFEREQRKEKS